MLPFSVYCTIYQLQLVFTINTKYILSWILISKTVFTHINCYVCEKKKHKLNQMILHLQGDFKNIQYTQHFSMQKSFSGL